jgi:hypothetical protein
MLHWPRLHRHAWAVLSWLGGARVASFLLLMLLLWQPQLHHAVHALPGC